MARERGGRATRRCSPSTTSAAAKAGRAAALYRRAAEQALEGGDPDAALARVARSVGAGAQDELRGELYRIEAEALRLLGRLADGERAAREAVSRLPIGNAGWFAALHELASISGRLGHGEELGLAARRLLEPPRDAAAETRRVIGLSVCAVHLLMAGRYDAAAPLLDAAAAAPVTDPLARAHVHQGRAFHALHAGDPAGYLAGLRDAAAEYERAGNRRNLCNARANVGAALIDMGASNEAVGLLREGLATADRLGASNIAAAAKLNLARALHWAGKADEARELAAAAAARAMAEGHKRMECAGARLSFPDPRAHRGPRRRRAGGSRRHRSGGGLAPAARSRWPRSPPFTSSVVAPTTRSTRRPRPWPRWRGWARSPTAPRSCA